MRVKGTGGTRPAARHLKNLIPIMSHFECTEHGGVSKRRCSPVPSDYNSFTDPIITLFTKNSISFTHYQISATVSPTNVWEKGG
jgi:hypothetical protein